MAIVNKQEIIKQIIAKLRLDPARDQVPVDIIDKIMPVMVINETGEIKEFIDTALNSSSKFWVVPDGMIWEIQTIWVRFDATATVGTRTLVFQLLDENNVTRFQIGGDLNITANGTAFFVWSPDNSTTDVSASLYSVQNCPRFVMENWTLRIIDTTAVDAAADDMVVSVMVKEKSMEA